MHVNSDDDPTEVKGKLTINCIISELSVHNYKVTGRLIMDFVVKEG